MKMFIFLVLSLATHNAAQETCATVKRAFRNAGCCGATPTKPVTLSSGMYRAGGESKVAKNYTAAPIAGGTLYVYNPASGTEAWHTFPNGKSYVDLADSSIAAGCVPKHKPHVVLPSPDGKYAAIAYTGDQDVAILKTDEHKVMFCPTVDFLRPSVFGGATHTGAWYGSRTFLLLDMTGCVDGVCGGAIHRFDFEYDGDGVMTGYEYVTSLGVSGVKEARNTTGTKPIALWNNPLGAYAHLFFVTDAIGAGSIMDADTMTWVKHFHVEEFGACPSGGLWVEPHPSDEKIVLAQYGKQDGTSCIFKSDLSALTMELLVRLADNTDAHGLQFCETSGGELTVINTGRQTSTLDVIKYADGSFLLQGYDMNTQVYDKIPGGVDKLQPDVVYLHGDFLYMAARGPEPVSAVKPQNFMENAHPGMMVLKIDRATCLPAAQQSDAFMLQTLERSPAITSDVHGVWGVMNGNQMEIWAVDQAGTGSVQAYYVYSDIPAHGTTDVGEDKEWIPKED